MAKELPYFKFEPAEYLTKDISFCSLSAQGLFINICSYYWQRNCKLTKQQLLKRLNHPEELEELISEGALDLIDNLIIIKFLDYQLLEVEGKSKINSSNGSKGGRPKKNPIESEIKPKLNPIESESKGIREEEIRKENNNDRIFSELIISESWLESTAMQSKQKFIPNEVKKYLKSYNDMINVQFEIKVNKTEYCTHFVNWLNKQEKKTGIKKPSLL